MTIVPEGRTLASSTDYPEVSCEDVVAVYVNAYTNAGFKLKSQNVKKGETNVGGTVTRIEFEFPNPTHPLRRPGVSSFIFVSRSTNKSRLQACSVSAEVFGADPTVFTPEEWNSLISRMSSAAKRAAAEIIGKLGNGVSSVP